MPKVKERFATGGITPGHVNALANAAEKVGPETVDRDEGLLEAADQMLPAMFDRHARKWSDQKLAEAGLDPLERQRRAREAKLWVEKDTGLGVVMAKLPRPQFEQLLQAVDSHYLHHLHQDGADGRDPDEVRTPKQVSSTWCSNCSPTAVPSPVSSSSTRLGSRPRPPPSSSSPLKQE